MFLFMVQGFTPSFFFCRMESLPEIVKHYDPSLFQLKSIYLLLRVCRVLSQAYRTINCPCFCPCL